MSKNKVYKNYLLNLSYQILITVLPLVTIPYLTRILGAKQLGIERYVESVVSVFTVFGLMGLVWYANRAVAYNRQDRTRVSKCFWEIFLMRVLLLAVTSGVYIWFIDTTTYKSYYYIFLIHIAGTFLDIGWFFTGIEEMKPIVIRNYIIRIISTILLFVLVKNKNDLGVYIWLVCCTTMANAVIMLPFVKRYVDWVNIRQLNVMGHFLPALALFLPQAASQIYVQCDKIMLNLFLHNSAYVSYYSENEKIAKIPIILVSALSTVLMPRIAHEYISGKRDAVKNAISKSFFFTCFILLPCCTGLMATANDVVPLFLGSEYAATWPVLVAFCPVMILIGISHVTGIQYLVALDKTRELTISYVVAAVMNICINYLLIPRLGMYGAIIGTLLAEGSAAAIQYLFLKRDIGSLYQGKRLLKFGVLSVIMGMIVYYAGTFFKSHILSLGVKVLLGVLIYGAGIVVLKEFPFRLKE